MNQKCLPGQQGQQLRVQEEPFQDARCQGRLARGLSPEVTAKTDSDSLNIMEKLY